MLAKRLGQLASPTGSLLRAGSLATARPANAPRTRRISMSSQSGDDKRKLWKDFDLPPSPLVGEGTPEDRFFEIALCRHRPLYLDTSVSHLFSDSAATKRMDDFIKSRPNEYAQGTTEGYNPLFPNAMSVSGQVTNPEMMHFSKNVTADLYPYEKYYSPQKSEFEVIENARSDADLLKFIGEAVKKFEAKNTDADLEMTSVKRKRKIKMNKHKYKKRRKAQRALRRKLDK
ncbi:hypothetical protein B0I72DRAFT_150019 [Yarrowia lipolytica]|jgi:hypothetical protein|uniref:Small ribosomal subunit protein mS38 n=2 Tax=Yarrowia lipolytica TaxID=4952 RepID=Q6CDM3_YARLI|nr:YALI0B22836p [Yarrowia lipolytica CLIB122]AOW02093.1 hypothetical protein YALI1_B29779g [Yarrowia lipolytica]KAB8283481.1 hypothetical protein BKA91DRAFT_97523 [Yarrowia lipolytica]KAE8173286.1 hypothetical protein BKA90DRAFT_135839 [Yarrowia lipolytica]KAJ8052855.1 hypothetical protein LXG23DRAFT_38892 [Yarrowia lipolytica]QNP96967.1 Hypothetical protein YALI2_C00620g [Yarrowia lipolytica]|eukprot:XP_501239.1 YALI0B22836p [Yarrowia lipolytica CLIB122]